jgi:hypothetical protein
MGQMHYLPLALPFFALLVGAFLVVLALIQIGIRRKSGSRFREAAPGRADCPHEAEPFPCRRTRGRRAVGLLTLCFPA